MATYKRQRTALKLQLVHANQPAQDLQAPGYNARLLSKRLSAGLTNKQ